MASNGNENSAEEDSGAPLAPSSASAGTSSTENAASSDPNATSEATADEVPPSSSVPSSSSSPAQFQAKGDVNCHQEGKAEPSDVDGVPVSAAPTAAMHEAMEGRNTDEKGSGSKPELFEDRDDEARVPPSKDRGEEESAEAPDGTRPGQAPGRTVLRPRVPAPGPARGLPSTPLWIPNGSKPAPMEEPREGSTKNVPSLSIPEDPDKKLEQVEGGDDYAPVPPSAHVSSLLFPEDSDEVSKRKPVPVGDGSDEAPVPPSALVASLSIPEDPDATSKWKPELVEDGDDCAPVPASAQVPSLLFPEDSDEVSKRKPVPVGDGSDEAPVPPSAQVPSLLFPEDSDEVSKRKPEISGGIDAPTIPASHAQYEGSDPATGKTAGMRKERGPAEAVGPAASPVPRDSEPRVDRSNESTAVPLGGPSNDAGGSNASAGDPPGGEDLPRPTEPSAHVIPEAEAYLVEEGGDPDELYIAEPLPPPWYRRKRVVAGMLCALASTAAAAVAAVVLSRPDPPATQIVTVTVQAGGNTTAPTLSQGPTVRPTGRPSSSAAPTPSPTDCARGISSRTQALEWVDREALGARIAGDGTSAVVAAHNSPKDTYVAFYAPSDDGDGWTRRNFAVFDENPEGGLGYDVSLHGNAAAVGFQWADTAAGINSGEVLLYRRLPTGEWEEDTERLAPAGGGREGVSFGASVALGEGLACVVEKPPHRGDQGAYVFRRAGGRWEQVLRRSYFSANECHVAGDTVAVRGYDGVNEFISLTSFREGEVGEEQVVEDSLISAMGLSESHLVYSVSHSVSRRVFVYGRRGPDKRFALLQEIGARENDDDFAKHVALDRDLLLLRGSNQTHVYSLQDSIFEEVFRLDTPYTTFHLSGRNVIAADAEGGLFSFSVRDCTQPMPTQLPSLSPAPFTSMFSLAPTSSQRPSSSPSFSISPTEECDWVDILVSFDAFATETSWDLKKIGGSSEGGEVLVKSFDANGEALATLQVNGISYNAWNLIGSAIGTLSGADLCDCGIGASRCECAGEVCLLQRGEVFFLDKVRNCEVGGGVGAIVFNNNPEGDLSQFYLSGDASAIPAVVISQAEGQHLLVHGIGKRVRMSTELSHADSVCLVEGTYEFTIYDSEGNGLCCDYGKGYYTVTSSNGMVARGRKFLRSETTMFAIPFDPSTAMLCSNIDIRISPRMGSGKEEAVSWELGRQERDGTTTVVFDSGGPLISSGVVIVQECVPDGRYYFTIHDTGNDLSVLGEPYTVDNNEKRTSYTIFTDDIIISSSYNVYDGDTSSFTLPYTEDEEDGSDVDSGVCNTDMVVYIVTDETPEKTSWTLVESNTGEILAKGGPYKEPFGGWYTHHACLPDGNFVFVINGEDCPSLPYNYAVYVERVLVFDAGPFGRVCSHSFTLPLAQMPSTSPTKSSAPSSTMSPTRPPSLSLSPTEICDLIEIRIDFNWLIWPLSWEIWKILPIDDVVVEEGWDTGVRETYIEHVCLQKGQYEFAISSNWTGNGAVFPGQYNVTVMSTGNLIAQGEGIGEKQRTFFELPFDLRDSRGGT